MGGATEAAWVSEPNSGDTGRYGKDGKMSTAKRDIGAGADIIDVRDICARIEELGPAHGTCADTGCLDEVGHDEYEGLVGLMGLLAGNGGDEEWQGEWYPLKLILDSYFEDHAREEAGEIYSEELSEARWPFNCIDWREVAAMLRRDYISVEYGGYTYWYR